MGWRSFVMGRRAWAFLLTLGMALLLDGASGRAQVNINNYASTPPNVTKTYAPNVLLLVSNSHTGFFQGYAGKSDYNNAVTYYGYFDPDKCYKYDSANQYFYTQDTWNAVNHYTVNAGGEEPDGSTSYGDKDMWSGNFLNWVSMCHADFMRKTLTGGRVADGGTDNSTYWLLERGDIPNDCAGSNPHCWTKTYVPTGTLNPDIGGLIPFSGYDPRSYTREDPAPGNRLLHFPFDPGTWVGTPPAIQDTAGYNNSGTPRDGAAMDTGRPFWGGGSLRLNGSSQYVEVADHPEISSFPLGQLTVEFWMYRVDATREALIIGNGGERSKNGFQVVSMAGGALRFSLYRDSSAPGYVDTRSTPTNSEWHHIVCVYTKAWDHDDNSSTPPVGAMRIYIDGCLDAEGITQFSGNVGDSTMNLAIGKSLQPPYQSRYFNGNLDEVSLWKEAFTTDMVRTRYETGWDGRTVSCLKTFGGSTFDFINVGTTLTVKAGTETKGTYTVRVKVTEQPKGLVEEFSDSIRFGLMSYSYDETAGGIEQGGVLRANVSGPGITTETEQLMTFVNTFTRKGWDPVAEMYWEATRYLRNSGREGGTVYGATEAFLPPSGTKDKDGPSNQFPIATWQDPVSSPCQRNFIIVVNDEYPSRDLDKSPGSWTPTGVTGLPAEASFDLEKATVKGARHPSTAGLDVQWWTDKVGEFEAINNNPWYVGCYENTCTCSDWTCDSRLACDSEAGATRKTVERLSRAWNYCPREPWPGQQASFNLAGAAYWAHMTHLRPDWVSAAEVSAHPEKKISVETFCIAMRASPYGYVVPQPPMNPLWLAAKYGGFQDKDGDGTPQYTDPATGEQSSEEWDADGDGVPDNFAYAERGEQFAGALRQALVTIVGRAASGTAASILSASRSGQGALYQAMFYPGRVDKMGNRVDWTGHLNAFWVDQYGNLREDTVPYVNKPSTIIQPFGPTEVSTDGIPLRQLDVKQDKIIRPFFDTPLGRTRARLYPVSEFGRIVAGKATAADTTGQLWDAGANFLQAGVKPGYTVENLTKGTRAQIDTPAPGRQTVKVTSVEASGISQWDPGDEYVISQEGPEPPVDLEALAPIWDGGRWLAENHAKDRHIFTWVDSDSDRHVSGERALFGPRLPGDEIMELAGSGSKRVTVGKGAKATSVTESAYVLPDDEVALTLGPYLRATSNIHAAAIINWIRGVDQPEAGLRKRTLLTPNNTESGLLRTLKLGDIIHSTPTIAGTPAEDFDLIYQDHSYTEFYRKYGDRRNVIYVGANDGMLHAFNAGFYDRRRAIFYDHTGHALGEELWAFIPYALLPHLEFLTQRQYVHVYYVDLKPKVFDARIFEPDSVHINGWGTLLLVGMGLGGKAMGVDVNGNGLLEPAETFRSAYSLLDVTEPLRPRLLGCFSDASLGLTTSYPAVFRVLDKWFMVVGSGPNALGGADAYGGVSGQSGWIYAAEITSSGFAPPVKRSLASSEVLGTPADTEYAFLGDPAVLDLDLRPGVNASGLVNWSAEIVYIGSVYDADRTLGAPYQWRGRMYRIRLTSDAALTAPDDTGASWNYSRLAESSATLAVGPITASANVARDDNGRRWVYFGSGRLFSSDDLGNRDRQAFFGLKEPVVTSGPDVGKPSLARVAMEADTNPNSSTSLLDATESKVYEGGLVDVDGNGSIDYAAAVEGGWNGFISALDMNKNGWVIRTSPGERVLGTAAVLGGIVAFTTWQPPDATAVESCQTEGTSSLYAAFYKSGTPFGKPVLGLGKDTYTDASGAHREVLRKQSLGTGISSTPTLHIGERGKAFIQNSTGSISEANIDTVYPVKSGVRSWRMH